MTSTDSSIVSDDRAGSSLGFRSEKDRPSRSLLARGSRILRRQGSKINIVATLDEEDEADREKARPERELFGRRARNTDHSKCAKQRAAEIVDPIDPRQSI